MSNTYVVLGILLAFAVIWYFRTKDIKDIAVPAPEKLNPDMLYGYYGTMDTQALETKDCTNLLWESQFQGIEKATQNILEGQKHTVLDVGPQLFVRFTDKGKNHKFNTNAEAHLRELFNYLQRKGALQFVKHIVPLDEPNTNVTSVEDFQLGIDTIKTVSKDYPELLGVKLAVIYAAKPTDYTCIEQFDLVGLDDYEAKSRIFVNGTYQTLKNKLRPDQRTMLVPGGAFGQDLVPFYNFANSNAEVAAIIAFTWLGPMVPADGWIGLGNNDNPLKQQYMDIGKKIVSK